MSAADPQPPTLEWALREIEELNIVNAQIREERMSWLAADAALMSENNAATADAQARMHRAEAETAKKDGEIRQLRSRIAELEARGE